MKGISNVQLYLLRGMYLVIAVGLALTMWPGLFSPPENQTHMGTVVRSVLVAVSLLALLGLRYPVKMLPVLFFELVWKTIWLVTYGLPLWSAGQLDAATGETFKSCLVGVVLTLIAIPWPYVFTTYLKEPADKWRAGLSMELN